MPKLIPTAYQKGLGSSVEEAKVSAKPDFLPQDSASTAQTLAVASKGALAMVKYQEKQDGIEATALYNQFQKDFDEQLNKQGGFLDKYKGAGSTKKILKQYKDSASKYANGKNSNVSDKFLMLVDSAELPIHKSIAKIERKYIQAEDVVSTNDWESGIVDSVIKNGFQTEDIGYYEEQYGIKNRYQENGVWVYPKPSKVEINDFKNKAQKKFIESVKQEYLQNPTDSSAIINMINTGKSVQKNPELFDTIKDQYKNAIDYQKNSSKINELVNKHKDRPITKLKKEIKDKGYNDVVKQGAIQGVENYKRKLEVQDNEEYMKLFSLTENTWSFKNENDAMTAIANVSDKDEGKKIVKALFGKGNPVEMFDILETQFTVNDMIKSKAFNREQIAVLAPFAFSANQTSEDYSKKRQLLDKFLNLTKGEYYEEPSWFGFGGADDKASARLSILESISGKIAYRGDEDIKVLEREIAFEVMNFNKLIKPVGKEDKVSAISNKIGDKMISDIFVLDNMYNEFNGTRLQMLKMTQVLAKSYTGTNKEFDVYNLKDEGYNSNQQLKAFNALIRANLKPTKSLMLGELE